MNYIKNPSEIEKKSFEIITKELNGKIDNYSEIEKNIIKRVIHTTADFEYADLIEFKNNSIEKIYEILKNPCKIYCDTNMILNGLNKMALKKLNLEAYTLIADEEIKIKSKELNLTRSILAMQKALNDKETKIFLIGNAPTALFTLIEELEKKRNEIPFIIGVPVGFVGASESKEALDKIENPFIRVNGRKGGSTVAVAILHSILYEVYKREGF